MVKADAWPSLRERKKHQTQETLSWAALRLAVDRGLAEVLVPDIAAAAGVSPRTFNNYFSSKYEAIAWRHLDRVGRVAELLRARPVEEALWDALRTSVMGVLDVSEPPDPAWLKGVRLMLSEPELQGEILKAEALAERALAAAIAERTGTDVERDLYPLLVAAAVGAASSVASQRWLRSDPAVPIGVPLRDALDQLAAGLPEPVGRES